MHETEITIPVPWGLIAGKTWNKPTGTPVLLVHGFQDNAASFDKLVPLLPDSFYYVAIDLPGHGKSSHFQWGLPLKALDAIPTIERAVDFLGWNDFIYIGHSLGGVIGYFYCAIFPKRVCKLVAIEAFVRTLSDKDKAKDVVSVYNKGLKEAEKRSESRKSLEYTYDEAVARILNGRYDYISLGSARMLAARCLEKSGEGYKFSVDQRLKTRERPCMSLGQTAQVFKRIQCPVLDLHATKSYNALWQGVLGKGFKNVRDLLDKNTNRSYRKHIVDGGHNVHMDFPERVSDILTVFIANDLCRL